MISWKDLLPSRSRPEPAPVPPQPAAPPPAAPRTAQHAYDEGLRLFGAGNDHDGALTLLREALARFDTPAERDEHRAAVVCNAIGLILKLRHDLLGAEPMFRRASSYFERVHGLSHHDTATTMHNLGATLLARGQVEAGGELLTRSFDLICRFHADDKLDLMHAHQHQALLHQARGELGRTIASYRKALEVADSFLAPAHWERRDLLRSLATELVRAGDHAEALRCWKRLAEVVASGTSESADLAVEIGEAEVHAGDPAVAMESFLRAGAIHDLLGAPLEGYRVRAMVGLAKAHAKSGADDKAESTLQQLLRLLEDAGLKGLSYGEVGCELGMFRISRGRYAEARAVLERAYAVLEEHAGPRHHLTCEALGQLAEALEYSGDRTTAETHYRSVVERTESWKRFKEGWIAIYADRVGRLCQQRRAPEEAEVWLRRAIRNAEVAWGAHNRSLPAMRHRLGTVLEAQGDHNAAWNTLLQALDGFIRTDQLTLPEVGELIERVVRMARAAPDRLESQAFVRDLIARFEGAVPDNHPTVARLYRAMGELLLDAGKPHAAVPWLERSIAMGWVSNPWRPEVQATCRQLEDARVAVLGARRRPWTDGLPPAGATTTWELRTTFDRGDWDDVDRIAKEYLSSVCETWTADSVVLDWINDDPSCDAASVGPVARFEATCGAHEHLVVVSLGELVVSVMGDGTAGLESRLVDLETRLLLALAQGPRRTITRWTLATGVAGMPERIAEGDAAALVARLAPP